MNAHGGTRGRLSRSGFLVAAALLYCTPAGAQADGWTFAESPFVDLWSHGMALIGIEGPGPTPLYSQEYAWTVRRSAQGAPTPLDDARGSLRTALGNDEAFEILHFVPLYLHDLPVEQALSGLETLGTRSDPASGLHAHSEWDGIANVLPDESRRDIVGTFASALRGEIPRVRTRAGGDPRATASLETVSRTWKQEYSTALSDFLKKEHASGGTLLLSPAIGTEGRVLARGGRPTLVALGWHPNQTPHHLLTGLVRELCFPVVRRLVDPIESRLGDRRTATAVSERVATRCAELLLSEHLPHHLPALYARMDVAPTGLGPSFLSKSGFRPGIAILERELEARLRDELNLIPDTQSD